MLERGSANHEPLAGLRLAVTAADLEQLEHRGIAAYSRNLLKALSAGGAEVWLITEFDPRLQIPGFKRLPKATQELLRAAKILDDLCAGHSTPEMSSYGLESLLPPGIQRIHRIGTRLKKTFWKWLSAYIPVTLVPRHYKEDKMQAILVHEHHDNPYLRHQRLDYLDVITGILCAPRFFGKANWLASRTAHTGVRFKLQSFDALITTCPMNVTGDCATPVLQSIHDLIPVEFARHGESPVTFTRRLQAALGQSRLFMSKASQAKYHHYIGKDVAPETVLVQPPSLQIPLGLNPKLFESACMENAALTSWTWLPESLRYKNQKLQTKAKELQTLQYLLFNSSIEPRKNAIFLVKAFLESKLAERGYSLCIVGSLKQDSYSDVLKKIVDGNPYIMLTGYVDEPTKYELYSRCLALTSPSLVEGFGIPVLDAACMGIPTIASESASHSEIRDMHDFSKFITLARTIKTTSWASLFEKLADRHECLSAADTESLVNQRMSRYEEMQALIESNFATKLQEAILKTCHLD